MNNDIGSNDASVESPLHGDGFAFGHDHAILPARPGVDKRASAAVLNQEFVAEDFSHFAL